MCGGGGGSVAQSCPTLCNPIECSPPGSSVCGISQAILEWVAISFSKGSSWPRNWSCISCLASWYFYLSHLGSPSLVLWVHVCSVISVMFSSLWSYGLQPARLLCPWDSSGKNTGVGCHALLQGIFPTRGLNLHLLHLLHCRFFTPEPPGKPFSYIVIAPYLRNKMAP